MEVAHTATTMIVSILGPWLVQGLDKRRMDAVMRRRTWPVATWGAALYAFGPLSMLGWVFVTRPFPRRALVAVPYTLLATTPAMVVEVIFARVAEPPEGVSGAELGQALVANAAAVVVLMLIIEAIRRVWRLTVHVHRTLTFPLRAVAATAVIVAGVAPVVVAFGILDIVMGGGPFPVRACMQALALIGALAATLVFSHEAVAFMRQRLVLAPRTEAT